MSSSKSFITTELDVPSVSVAGSITTTRLLDDLNFMLGFDALWVAQRWFIDFFSCDPTLLSATEMANIAAFSATGRR